VNLRKDHYHTSTPKQDPVQAGVLRSANNTTHLNNLTDVVGLVVLTDCEASHPTPLHPKRRALLSSAGWGDPAVCVRNPISLYSLLAKRVFEKQTNKTTLH